MCVELYMFGYLYVREQFYICFVHLYVFAQQLYVFVKLYVFVELFMFVLFLDGDFLVHVCAALRVCAVLCTREG